MFTREPVESSLIKSVGYDPVTYTLEIVLHSGSVYHYHEVPDLIYQNLKIAESKGRYFNEQIKPHYRYEMVGRPAA